MIVCAACGYGPDYAYFQWESGIGLTQYRVNCACGLVVGPATLVINAA